MFLEFVLQFKTAKKKKKKWKPLIISGKQVSHDALLQAERRCRSEPDGGATVSRSEEGKHGCKPLRGRKSFWAECPICPHEHTVLFVRFFIFLLYFCCKFTSCLSFPRLDVGPDSDRFQGPEWSQLLRGGEHALMLPCGVNSVQAGLYYFFILCQRSFQLDTT